MSDDDTLREGVYAVQSGPHTDNEIQEGVVNSTTPEGEAENGVSYPAEVVSQEMRTHTKIHSFDSTDRDSEDKQASHDARHQMSEMDEVVYPRRSSTEGTTDHTPRDDAVEEGKELNASQEFSQRLDNLGAVQNDHSNEQDLLTGNSHSHSDIEDTMLNRAGEAETCDDSVSHRLLSDVGEPTSSTETVHAQTPVLQPSLSDDAAIKPPVTNSDQELGVKSAQPLKHDITAKDSEETLDANSTLITHGDEVQGAEQVNPPDAEDEWRPARATQDVPSGTQENQESEKAVSVTGAESVRHGIPIGHTHASSQPNGSPADQNELTAPTNYPESNEGNETPQVNGTIAITPETQLENVSTSAVTEQLETAASTNLDETVDLQYAEAHGSETDSALASHGNGDSSIKPASPKPETSSEEGTPTITNQKSLEENHGGDESSSLLFKHSLDLLEDSTRTEVEASELHSKQHIDVQDSDTRGSEDVENSSENLQVPENAAQNGDGLLTDMVPDAMAVSPVLSRPAAIESPTESESDEVKGESTVDDTLDPTGHEVTGSVVVTPETQDDTVEREFGSTNNDLKNDNAAPPLLKQTDDDDDEPREDARVQEQEENAVPAPDIGPSELENGVQDPVSSIASERDSDGQPHNGNAAGIPFEGESQVTTASLPLDADASISEAEASPADEESGVTAGEIPGISNSDDKEPVQNSPQHNNHTLSTEADANLVGSTSDEKGLTQTDTQIEEASSHQPDRSPKDSAGVDVTVNGSPTPPEENLTKPTSSADEQDDTRQDDASSLKGDVLDFPTSVPLPSESDAHYDGVDFVDDAEIKATIPKDAPFKAEAHDSEPREESASGVDVDRLPGDVSRALEEKPTLDNARAIEENCEDPPDSKQDKEIPQEYDLSHHETLTDTIAANVEDNVEEKETLSTAASFVKHINSNESSEMDTSATIPQQTTNQSHSAIDNDKPHLYDEATSQQTNLALGVHLDGHSPTVDDPSVVSSVDEIGTQADEDLAVQGKEGVNPSQHVDEVTTAAQVLAELHGSAKSIENDTVEGATKVLETLQTSSPPNEESENSQNLRGQDKDDPISLSVPELQTSTVSALTSHGAGFDAQRDHPDQVQKKYSTAMEAYGVNTSDAFPDQTDKISTTIFEQPTLVAGRSQNEGDSHSSTSTKIQLPPPVSVTAANSIPAIHVAEPTPDAVEDDEHLSSLGTISALSEADKMSELSTIPSLATEWTDRTPRIGDVDLEEESIPLDALHTSNLVNQPEYNEAQRGFTRPILEALRTENSETDDEANSVVPEAPLSPRSDLGINSPTFDSRSEVSAASHVPTPPKTPRLEPLDPLPTEPTDLPSKLVNALRATGLELEVGQSEQEVEVPRSQVRDDTTPKDDIKMEDLVASAMLMPNTPRYHNNIITTEEDLESTSSTSEAHKIPDDEVVASQTEEHAVLTLPTAITDAPLPAAVSEQNKVMVPDDDAIEHDADSVDEVKDSEGFGKNVTESEKSVGDQGQAQAIDKTEEVVAPEPTKVSPVSSVDAAAVAESITLPHESTVESTTEEQDRLNTNEETASSMNIPTPPAFSSQSPARELVHPPPDAAEELHSPSPGSVLETIPSESPAEQAFLPLHSVKKTGVAEDTLIPAMSEPFANSSRDDGHQLATHPQELVTEAVQDEDIHTLSGTDPQLTLPTLSLDQEDTPNTLEPLSAAGKPPIEEASDIQAESNGPSESSVSEIGLASKSLETEMPQKSPRSPLLTIPEYDDAVVNPGVPFVSGESPDPMLPSPKLRGRHLSTSSGVLPGGWAFPTQSEGRPSLDMAAGEFVPSARSPTDDKKPSKCIIM